MKIFFLTLVFSNFFLQSTCHACFREISRDSIAENKKVCDSFPYKNNIAIFVKKNGELGTAFLITPRLALLNLHAVIGLEEGEKEAFLANENIEIYASTETGDPNYRKTLEEAKKNHPKKISYIKKFYPLSKYKILDPKTFLRHITIPKDRNSFQATLKELSDYAEKNVPTKKELMLSPSSSIACSSGKKIETSFDLILVELAKPLIGAKVIPLTSLLPREEDDRIFHSELPGKLYARVLPFVKKVPGKILPIKEPEIVDNSTVKLRTTHLSLKTMVKREGERFFAAEYLSFEGGGESISPNTYNSDGPQKALRTDLLAGSIIGGWSGSPLFAERNDGSLILLGFTSYQAEGLTPQLKNLVEVVKKHLPREDPRYHIEFMRFFERELQAKLSSKHILLDVFEAFTEERLSLIQEILKKISREVLRSKGLDTESFLKKVLGKNYEKSPQLKLLPAEKANRMIQEIEAKRLEESSKSS